MVGGHGFISWHQTSSLILSPTQKSLRWWKKELIQLIFHNYCSRKLMPHDTMPHSRVEISEGTSGMTVSLSPFFIGLFWPKLQSGNHRNNFCVSNRSLKGKAGARGRIGSAPSFREHPTVQQRWGGGRQRWRPHLMHSSFFSASEAMSKIVTKQLSLCLGNRNSPLTLHTSCVTCACRSLISEVIVYYDWLLVGFTSIITTLV